MFNQLRGQLIGYVTIGRVINFAFYVTIVQMWYCSEEVGFKVKECSKFSMQYIALAEE